MTKITAKRLRKRDMRTLNAMAAIIEGEIVLQALLTPGDPEFYSGVGYRSAVRIADALVADEAKNKAKKTAMQSAWWFKGRGEKA